MNVSLSTRFYRGWTITKTGWRFIKEHKVTLIYPLLSLSISIGIIAFIGSLTGGLHIAHALLEKNKNFPVGLAFGLSFLFYFSLIFASSFMHTALSSYINDTLDKGKGSFFASIRHALSRFFTLITWSVISTLLAVVFDWLNNNKNKFPFNIIVGFIGATLNLMWSMLTFFVVPIIAAEQLGAIATIEKSGKIMKKMWGESVAATFAISFIGLLLFIACASVIWGGAYLLQDLWFPQPITHTPEHTVYASRDALYFMIFLCTIAALPFFIVIPITSVAQVLFKTIVYRFSQEKTTGPFSTDFIKSSFTGSSNPQ